MKRKILFFIAGPVPTEAEKREASEIVGNVVFRNAKFAGAEPPEPCDGVAGCAPENYKNAGVELETVQVDDVERPKRGRKPKAEQEPTQTPLIPAETGWKANS